MSYLINGKTPDEVKSGLSHCWKRCRGGEDGDCPYYVECRLGRVTEQLEKDALILINHLESERDAALAKALKWVDAKVELPKVDGEYLAYVICPKGRWMETLKFERYDDCHRWIKEIDYAYVEETTDFVVAWAVADLPEGIAE